MPRWDCLNIYLREPATIVPVTMFILKYCVAFLVLCTLPGTLSKPVGRNLNEGRGIGSTIWDWLTYPFTWWTSNNDIVPESDQLLRFTTHKPFDAIEIGKHNVTIWCNDQTCTTMRCDKFGCVNISCSIYDTDLKGECREYNTIVKPEEPSSQKPGATAVKPLVRDMEVRTTVTPAQSTTATTVLSTESLPNQAVDERPLELEAVLSSTVTESLSKPTQTTKPNN